MRCPLVEFKTSSRFYNSFYEVRVRLILDQKVLYIKYQFDDEDFTRQKGFFDRNASTDEMH